MICFSLKNNKMYRMEFPLKKKTYKPHKTYINTHIHTQHLYTQTRTYTLTHTHIYIAIVISIRQLLLSVWMEICLHNQQKKKNDDTAHTFTYTFSCSLYHEMKSFISIYLFRWSFLLTPFTPHIYTKNIFILSFPPFSVSMSLYVYFSLFHTVNKKQFIRVSFLFSFWSFSYLKSFFAFHPLPRVNQNMSCELKNCRFK